MRALDTNILVRFLTADDPEQARVAKVLLTETLTAAHPGFVSVVVLCETAWTLERFYDLGQRQIRDALLGLLTAPQLVFGDEAAVRAALDGELGLADLLIHELGRRAGCAETVTFDRRFARLPGVRLLG